MRMGRYTKEDKRINERVLKHIALTKRYEEEGMTHEEASKKAYDEITNEARGKRYEQRCAIATMERMTPKQLEFQLVWVMSNVVKYGNKSYVFKGNKIAMTILDGEEAK